MIRSIVALMLHLGQIKGFLASEYCSINYIHLKTNIELLISSINVTGLSQKKQVILIEGPNKFFFYFTYSKYRG